MIEDLKKKICVLLTHLNTGDNLTNYPMTIELSKKYKEVYIYCLYRNKKMIEQIYQYHPNIKFYIIQNKDHNHCLIDNNSIIDLTKNLEDFDIIRTGFHGHLEDQSRFWLCFYKQAGLDYSIRYLDEYKKINRNLEKENELYQKIKSTYGDKYIFVHDHRSIGYQHNNLRKNVELSIENINIPIFHPNFNYYKDYPENPFYSLWNIEFMTDNILDYGLIIENSIEIHVNDSSFSCYLPYLNISTIQIKKVYTSISKENLISYHSTFNDFILC